MLLLELVKSPPWLQTPYLQVKYHAALISSLSTYLVFKTWDTTSNYRIGLVLQVTVAASSMKEYFSGVGELRGHNR